MALNTDAQFNADSATFEQLRRKHNKIHSLEDEQVAFSAYTGSELEEIILTGVLPDLAEATAKKIAKIEAMAS